MSDVREGLAVVFDWIEENETKSPEQAAELLGRLRDAGYCGCSTEHGCVVCRGKSVPQMDVFRNFVEHHSDVFTSRGGISLKRAFDMWLSYCEQADIVVKMPKYKFREELMAYFEGFEDQMVVNGVMVRSYFVGFKTELLEK